MTIKELKDIIANASDNDKLELVNGEITLVKEKPIEYKFNVGDKVKDNGGHIGIITSLTEVNGWPWYQLNGESLAAEEWLELVPQDITERIKTFEDAYQWCEENKPKLCKQWQNYCNTEDDDVEAYIKLRIITAALNEGWEPKFDGEEQRWYICADEDNYGGQSICRSDGVITLTESSRLLFKSDTLAEYASKQFLNIYRDFCGISKGGEK